MTNSSGKILIVDDEPFNILALESYFRDSDVITEAVYNGKEAVNKFSHPSVSNIESSYNLIIMDCQMPVMDGFEATRTLVKMMSEDKIPNIPIIGCTAFDGEEYTTLCYDAGMAQVLKKPLSKVKIDQIKQKSISTVLLSNTDSYNLIFNIRRITQTIDTRY